MTYWAEESVFGVWCFQSSWTREGIMKKGFTGGAVLKSLDTTLLSIPEIIDQHETLRKQVENNN